MGEVYTETFIYTELAGPLVVYEVPENKRAVVTCVTFTAIGTGAAGNCYARVHGVAVAGAQLQAGFDSRVIMMRVVCYERATISCALELNGMACTISGYMFEDHSGRNQAPGELELEYSEFSDRIEPLPSSTP